MGIPCIEDEIDIARVTTAFKVLGTDEDPVVSTVARGLLEEVARKRTGGLIEMEKFLNSPPAPGEGRKADIKSLWSAVRKSLQRFSATIDIQHKTLTCGGKVVGWGKRRDISKLLRAQRHKEYINQLKTSPDQGRTFSCVSAHPASNSFIRSGRYFSFGEYRFAIKARLNPLPTKTVLRRCGKTVANVSCPVCNMEQETLAHILNHCGPNEGLIRARHNAILHRLSKAIPTGQGRQFLEQSIPGDTSALKPDLVVLDELTHRATVIDVSVPFEGEGLLEESRRAKVAKYSYLEGILQGKGYTDVDIDAFIVGSLGSWDPLNEPLLRRLRISERYLRTFRRLCSWQAIHGSYAIWEKKRQH